MTPLACGWPPRPAAGDAGRTWTGTLRGACGHRSWPALASSRISAETGARAAGTPFISVFAPAGMLTLACEAGFAQAQSVSAATLAQAGA
jgi:hypothetical protein